MTTSFSSLFWPSLPNISSLIACAACSILLFVITLKYKLRSLYCVVGALTAVTWMASVGYWYTHWQLPAQEIKQITEVTGQVTSVVIDETRISFTVDVHNTNLSAYDIAILRPNIKVSWMSPKWPVKQGQRISLAVKLKPRNGVANEGGFRYQQWLLSEKIVAVGYVKGQNKAILLRNHTSARQKLSDQLFSSNLHNVGWIAALTIGVRNGLTQSDWALIQSTGLAHLIAISGLHLGMIATLTFFIVHLFMWLIQHVVKLPQDINYQHLALIIVVMVTGYYAHLAGWSLPTLRAWLMLVFGVILVLCRCNIGMNRFILYSIFVFILISPLSLLSASFWLSFAAIAIIALSFWRWPMKPPLSEQSIFQRLAIGLGVMIRLQLALSLLMVPIVATQFGVVSLSGPMINLLAIPVVSFLIVPLCFLGSLLLAWIPTTGLKFFAGLDQVFNVLIEGLVWLDTVLPTPWLVSHVSFGAWIGLAVFICVVFSPVHSILKWQSSVVLVPFIATFFPPSSNQWYVHVLDVGQGLSVIIERNKQVLVYDVGAGYPSGFNMADTVLIPFLRTRGISSIDMLVISHFDNDHSGAMADLFRGVEVKAFMSSQDICIAPRHFTWSGLRAQVLWPIGDTPLSKNDRSCVIKIADRFSSVLLTGDISRHVERNILQMYSKQTLASHIMLAPHHGSNTSSSTQFIETVAPDYAVFSSGFLNRWRFPAQTVVNRYVAQQVKLLDTASSGQITIEMSGTSPSYKVNEYRKHIFPAWYLHY